MTDTKQIVLFVGYNPHNLKIFKEKLENNCKIISLISGDEAIALITTIAPDVVALVEPVTHQVERAAFIGMHAAEIAHDMNGSLAIISSCMTLLEKKYPDETKLATVRQAAEKVINTIKTILQNSHEDNESIVGEFSIHSVIESELELFALDSFFKKQVYVERCFADLPPYFGNVFDFRRCFGNLIKNAVDSMHGRE